MSNFDFVIFGSNSPVGRYIIELLAAENAKLLSVSRRAPECPQPSVEWMALDRFNLADDTNKAETALCVFHIWLVPSIIPELKRRGIKRIVCLSSTSLFGKKTSTNLKEQQVRDTFELSEQQTEALCAEHGISLAILRPTLIYGDGRDKNISEICAFIDRFGFFPVFGKASGLRQPIHAKQVAIACIRAARASNLSQSSYNIPGGETLTYRAMLQRIFELKGRRARILSVPIWLFSAALSVLRLLPRFQHWTKDMAERMNQNLAFDLSDAKRDFGFDPGPFTLSQEDLTRR